MDIIKGFLAFIGGGAMLLGGAALVIFKFIKSEHADRLLHAGIGTARLLNGSGPAKESWWQAGLGLIILCTLAILLQKIEQWRARRRLSAGDGCAKQGDHERAVRNYDAAIKIHPEYADAYHNRGFAQLALGQIEQAQNDFARAHELDASLPLLETDC